MALDTPFYRSTSAGEQVRQVRELVLSQHQADAGQADQLAYGHAHMGVDQIEAGGFDNLTLASDGLLSFDGDVSLSLGQSLSLYGRVLGLTDTASDSSQVRLAASYVRLAGYGGLTGRDNYIHPTVQGGSTAGISSQPLAGNLQLNASQLLELRDILSVGVHGGTGAAEGLLASVDRRGFDQVELASDGDMRFLAATQADGSQLYVPGDLTLAAAQVYPGTAAVATVHAGWQGTNAAYDPERRLIIARTTDSAPALPYSVFGSLTLGAANIDQGGILRAPLGALNLGYSWTNQQTQTVNLLPGSITSVSAGGLLMPYGGTVDDQTWQFDGEDITLYAAGGTQGDNVNAARQLKVGMTLLGESVDIQQGAMVDLSGGGELLGAAFVSGRGGSTDARFSPLVQNGADGFTLPGLASNPVYAIVPGVQSLAAPAGGEAGASDPLLGQQVTIGSGVPGLPASTYTLMPSTYALLPDAYRVEVNGLAGQGAVTPAQAMRNGSWSVSGVLSIAGTGIRDSLASQLILTPADVLRSYSQYNEMSYADFVHADAARRGIPRGMLEADAKTLELSLRRNAEGASFNFDGTVLGEAAEGGFGSTLSVVVPNNNGIELLADDGQAAEGYISLYASDLSAMEVNRLVIGGRPVVLYGQGATMLTSALPSTLRLLPLSCARGGADCSRSHVGQPAKPRQPQRYRDRAGRLHQHPGSGRCGLRLGRRLYLPGR